MRPRTPEELHFRDRIGYARVDGDGVGPLRPTVTCREHDVDALSQAPRALDSYHGALAIPTTYFDHVPRQRRGP